MQSDKKTTYPYQEDEIDLRSLFLRILSKWHWFVFSVLAGTVLAFFVARYSQPVFEVKSSMLVEEQKNGVGFENFIDGVNFASQNNIKNHVGILNSYEITLQTLNQLGWRTSWYKKATIGKTDVYQNFPFSLKEMGDNIEGVELTISLTENNKYLLSASGKYQKEGLPIEIDFETEIEFGERFTNSYFDFVIDKTQEEIEDDYIFIFQENKKLALEYRKKVSVSQQDKNSELLTISIKGNNPKRIVDYINELCAVYTQFGLDRKNRISKNTVRFIDQQLEGIVDSLKIAGKNFTEFRSKKQSVDLSREAQLIIEKVSEIESEQANLTFRLDYYQSLLKYMNNIEEMGKMAAPSFVGIVDPSLNAQVVKLSDLYQRKTSLSHIVKDKNPSLILLNREINTIIKSLEENVRNLLKTTKTEAKVLQNRKDEISMRLASLPETEQEMINIKRRFDLNNELYTFLLKRRAEAAITTASNTSDTQVIDAARIETVEKIKPKVSMIIAIGGFLGLLIPVFLIFVIDFLNTTIQSKEDLERASELPVMGQIARNRYHDELAIMHHPRSGLAESFRDLRTNLQYIFKGEQKKVLAVHSMIPGEGKTFCSVNIATIIAMDNKKVLIVGCDLRKPRLHEVFEIRNTMGLSTYLINRHTFKEVIQPTVVDNLHIVNSGPIPPNPAELLGNECFQKFIDEAKEHYDYIVLDNAPVTLVTDGILTGKHADTNLFVLRQDYSKKEQVQFINQLETKKKMKKVGLVVNDTTNKSFGNAYANYAYGNGYYDDDHMPLSWKDRWKKLF